MSDALVQVDTVVHCLLTALQGQPKISDCHRTLHTCCPSDLKAQYGEFSHGKTLHVVQFIKKKMNSYVVEFSLHISYLETCIVVGFSEFKLYCHKKYLLVL